MAEISGAWRPSDDVVKRVVPDETFGEELSSLLSSLLSMVLVMFV